MTRLAGLILLGLLALPVEASNPNRIKKERPRPTQTAEPPLARPIPAPQQAAREPMLNERVVMALMCPQRVVAQFVADRMDRYRMARLLNESDGVTLCDLPPGLVYERLQGNIGP